MMKIDVLCVGVSAYDLVFSLSGHPQPDEKTSADALVSCGGGPAANAAVTVARLGLKSAFAGYVGSDFFGEQILEEFRSEDVVTDLILRGEEPTPLSVIIVKPNGDRAIVHYRGKNHYLSANSVDLSTIEPSVILFDGHEPDASVRLADYASSKGVKTVLDAGSVHRGTRELIDKVDYLVGSRKFALEFTGESSEEAAVQKLFEHNSSVVITRGDQGLVWKNESGEGHLPAFNVEVVDTTGAGDAFHGAFAACVALEDDWEYTLRYSSAVAARCCTKLGARIGMPTKEEVEELIGKSRV
jgi:sulfofructose kinase